MTPFTLPQILDLTVAPLELTPGSYTDLVNEAWNGQDVDTDPTLKQSDDAASALDANGGELTGAQDAISALTNHGQNLPNGGSTTFSDDMATATAAQAAKTATLSGALDGLPPLLTLPLNPAGSQYITAPPTQTNVDIGNIVIGTGVYVYSIGTGEELISGVVSGPQNLYIAVQAGASAEILEIDRETSAGNEFQEYSVQIKGTVLGKATVQVVYNMANQNFETILTFTMNVVAAS